MEPRNILIVKLSAIGDVVHALPVAYALRQRFPQAKISWIVEPPAYDLLQDNPCIDEVILFEKRKFKSLGGFINNIPALTRQLRRRHFDTVLDLQGLGKSAAIAWLTGAGRRLGTCDMRELSNYVSTSVVGRHSQGHIVERYLDVAAALGCDTAQVRLPLGLSEEIKSQTLQLLSRAGMSPSVPYAVLAVGANWPNKRWPTANYAAIADYLYNHRIIPVIVGSGVVDERLAAEIMAASEIPPINLVGRTTLRQLACVLQRAKLLIGGDTGAIHLAAALEIPVIAMLGPTNKERNGPWRQEQNVLEISRSCKNCWQRQCRLHLDCLADISVAAVQEKLQKMM